MVRTAVFKKSNFVSMKIAVVNYNTFQGRKGSRNSGIVLKVPWGQIGSPGEWYHWIGLEKDINRYRFLIFYL